MEINSQKSMRLNRAIASRGICSRRKADELIFAGRVKINGDVETNPARQVSDSDLIAIDGKEIVSSPKKLYLMLNKPVECVCTLSDPQGRRTIVDFFSDDLKSQRIFSVGRLDYFSEGLLLLTNDGDFAQYLAHPSHHQKKIYEVIVRGNVSDTALKNMRSGMILDDGARLLPVKVKAMPLKNGNTLLKMELRQGVNRQIRRMCAQSELTILRLRRISVGNLKLGNLEPGKIRPLLKEEIQELKKGS